MRYANVTMVTVNYMFHYNRNVSIIEPQWLIEVAPNYFRQTQLQDDK